MYSGDIDNEFVQNTQKAVHSLNNGEMVNLPIPSSAKKISFNGKRSERKQFEKGLEELMMKL